MSTVCAWCPDFDPTAESNRGVSHGICPACQQLIDAEIAAAEPPMSETSQTQTFPDAA